MKDAGNGEPGADSQQPVVNLLVRYARAVDDRDLDGVLAIVGAAEVTFGGIPTIGMDELAETYRSAFATGGRTRHLLHAVQVEDDGVDDVVARAAYQRWSLGVDAPLITALGQYTAAFRVHGGRVRLVRLTVDRDWQQRG